MIWLSPKRYKRCSLFLLFLYLLAFNTSYAQDKVEIGGMIGSASYMGDLNPKNPVAQPNVSGTIIVRYVLTDRIVVRANAMLTSLRGSYPNSNLFIPRYSSGAYLPDSITPYSFYRPLVGNVSAQLEINFNSFDHQFISKTKFSPYIAIGLGTTIYKRFVEDGVKPVEKPVFVLSLPLSLGVKYKLNDFVRVGLEWTFIKVFADDLDQTSSNSTITPSDPYGFRQSSFIINQDWISNLGVSITFNMFKRQTGCSAGYSDSK